MSIANSSTLCSFRHKLHKRSPSDQEVQTCQQRVSVWIQIAIYHHQDQSREAGFSSPPQPPSHLLCSYLTFLVLDLQSICQGCYLLPMIQAAALPAAAISWYEARGARRFLWTCWHLESSNYCHMLEKPSPKGQRKAWAVFVTPEASWMVSETSAMGRESIKIP